MPGAAVRLQKLAEQITRIFGGEQARLKEPRK